MRLFTCSIFVSFCYDRPQRLFPHLILLFAVGIKHDFPFINIRKVPWEVFNIPRGTLRMLMNDKIMFDRYYYINSKKTHQKLRKCLRTLFFLRANTFYKYPRFGQWPGTFSHDNLKNCTRFAWRLGKCINIIQ